MHGCQWFLEGTMKMNRVNHSTHSIIIAGWLVGAAMTEGPKLAFWVLTLRLEFHFKIVKTLRVYGTLVRMTIFTLQKN